MEEFEFQFDDKCKGFFLKFGRLETKLKVFDWEHHAKMMRRIRMHAIDNTEEQKRTQPMRPFQPWCEIEDFPELLDVFDMDCPMEQIFVDSMLRMYKPRAKDEPGFVYILQRQVDVQMLASGEISDILLHKIGCTKNAVDAKLGRVGHQARANGEEYHVLAYFKSSYHKFFEYACHRLYQERRVEKTDSKDGYTEWFLIHPTQLLYGIEKIRKALYYMHDDRHGWKP